MQLVAENLTVERGSRIILRDLSLTVPAGEALVLTGANGSGKTTLLRTLAGYLSAETGTVQFLGGDPEKSIAEQAHVVGHLNGIKANLTVRENVEFWAGFLDDRQERSERVAKALAHFGLGDLSDFPVGYLSAGQKRRAGLARLLAAYRPLWFLDEPTVSLDAASAKLLSGAINHHVKQGGIAVVATHLALGLANARELVIGSERSAA